MLDIYFNEAYGNLCTYIEKGERDVFVCDIPAGIVKNMFIKRPVPWRVNDKQFYDIITPYGYGGPIVVDCVDLETLLNEYAERFKQYCLDNDIICEFIRYHPIFRNWEPFNNIYNNIFSRHTVGTNLRDYEDPVQSEFSKSARKELRRAISKGVTCSVHPYPDDLSVFRKLYEETMDRNNAEQMYYFPSEYYDILTSDLQQYVLEVRAHLNDEIVGSELYFIQGNIMHAHLLGSNERLLNSGAGIMLEATAAKWGKDNGYHYIHHGGGRTSNNDDSLYLYKKKFGKNTEFDFYIGKRIWNEEIYNLLVQIRQREGSIENPAFFPQYRG